MLLTEQHPNLTVSDVASFVMTHRLYETLIAKHILWGIERHERIAKFLNAGERYGRHVGYRELISIIAATANAGEGGLQYAMRRDEAEGKGIDAARAAAKTILTDLADQLEREQEQLFLGRNIAPEVAAQYRTLWTKEWRP